MRTLVLLALLGVVALVGCAGDAGAADDTCQVSITTTPIDPIAGPTTEIRAASVVSQAPGTLVYSWNVVKGGTLVDFSDAQSDHSEIMFLATESGTYDVTLDVHASLGSLCPQGSAHVNVLANNMMGNARLHVIPPASAMAPLTDRAIVLHDGADFDMGPVVLDGGVTSSGIVQTTGGGIAAYLQFIPQGMDGAVVETFAPASGAYSVRLLNQTHDVIVVPAVAGLAPRKILNYHPTSTSTLQVDAGDTITGTVKQGATPIANAKVQLTIDGVPTTLGTTLANGSFTVQGVVVANATVKIEVTPQIASGLPRLEATGLLDVTVPVTVAYGALPLTNLVGTPVKRGAVAQPNKPVTIVGTVASVGTVTAGIAANGTGFVRIPTTTDGSGNLPSVTVPEVSLFAVTTVAPGDLAVGLFTAVAGPPAQIDAPAMTAFSTHASGVSMMLSGATLDLVPTRALALAGSPALHFIADANGAIAGVVPTGGAFDVRWSDPAGRRAPLVVPDTTQILATYLLPPAIYISGDLSVQGSSNPIVGASVQILCADCNGLDRNRPIAEVASDPHGAFSIAVPDPGPM